MIEASLPELRLPTHVKLVQTRHGPLFVLASDSTVSRALIQFGEWSFGEIELLQGLLRPGDHAADVGANIGTHTVSLAKIVGPSGSVLAFEPQPAIFQLLAANVLVNGLGNTDLFLSGCAASTTTIEVAKIDYAERGKYAAMSLADLRDHGSENSAAPRQRVQIVSLDEVIDRDSLRLIKIDVEGMEVDVLRGAERIIARHRPLIYVENEHPETSQPLLSAVRCLGYRAFWHAVPLYNPNNYYGVAENLIGHASCINNLCVPSEMEFEPGDLPEVRDVCEHPRRTAAMKATTLNAKAATVLCSQAMALQAAGRQAEALALFDKALAIDPHNSTARAQRGQCG